MLLGCKDPGITSPPQAVSVVLNFTSGFHADSLLLSCDSTIFARCRGWSDSLNVPAGYVFMTTEGVHHIALQMPFQNVRSDTTFGASRLLRTYINAHLDRIRMVITYEIIYHERVVD